MLSADDPRMEPLRRQAAAAQVIGMCKCGCATIYVEIDRDKADPVIGLEYAAVDSYTHEKADVKRLRELIVFVDRDGWLSSLELVDYGAIPPHRFPSPEEMASPHVR